MSRFYRAGEKAADAYYNNTNYDNDASFDDLYVTAASGWFRVRKPSVSVRGDTEELRTLIYNDRLDVYSGQDVQLKGNNGFYITQAINTGGAVNSFILDWQVPFWSTAAATSGGTSMSTENAPFETDAYAVARLLSTFTEVSTGVWEVPGAEYEQGDVQVPVLDAKGKVVTDAKGNVVYQTVTGNAKPLNKEAETESQLRLFMFARIVDLDMDAEGNVYEEQNGTGYIDHENFALAGSDADRDYRYGE